MMDQTLQTVRHRQDSVLKVSTVERKKKHFSLNTACDISAHKLIATMLLKMFQRVHI